jgi:hypothetical protein
MQLGKPIASRALRSSSRLPPPPAFCLKRHFSADNRGPTTHFGFQQVPAEEKAGLVGGVFSSVASSYDVMNDLMSMGLHR